MLVRDETSYVAPAHRYDARCSIEHALFIDACYPLLSLRVQGKYFSALRLVILRVRRAAIENILAARCDSLTCFNPWRTF